jgi:transposase-like protein
MRQITGTRKSPGERIVKDIKRATRKHYSSEEKIRVVLDGVRGEDSIAELCRREGAYPKASITSGLRTSWRLASGGWPGTHPVLPRPTKSRTCAVKPAISRKLWQSKHWNCAFSKKA